MAAAVVAVRPDEVYPGEGYNAFKEFLLTPSQPREIVVPVAKARPAMHEKASDVSSATSASTATMGTARSTRREAAKYYGIFEGWGSDIGSNADEKPDRPLTYKEKIAAAKSLRANDELITRNSVSFYGVFEGWGPDLDAQPEEAQHSTSNLSKKSNPTLYYGIFRGSGPSPAGCEEPKVDKPLTYNEKIAAAKSLSANDLNKSTSFYGLFDGWGPEPWSHDDTSKPKETKSGSTLYYGVFKGSGPSPEDVNTEVKPEKPLTYNQKIAASKSLKFEEAGECLYYGIFKGS